jgi:hypothetical protein
LPSFSWLIRSCFRRVRRRDPTNASIGVADLAILRNLTVWFSVDGL